MDFNERLEHAIQRGQRTGQARLQAEAEKAISIEELKRMHARFRLQLSEHIESCLTKLPNHFPGFQLEAVVGDRGWGAKVSRDDLGPGRDRKAANFYSRLELVIRPFSAAHVLELAAKGTIRNKEVYNRTHYQRLIDADPRTFEELIDLWTLEYAELYAAKS
jgi:hypothetical protein